jgi:ribosomal protein S7
MNMQKSQNKELKKKFVNILMNRGNKRTGENILTKSLKVLQKSTTKNHISLIQTSIINATPIFKINEQSLKKGKRKSKKETPIFITSDSLRVMLALKFIRSASIKKHNSGSFYKVLAQELQDASSVTNSQSVEQKNELQKRTLLNKRYLAKFRW